jgi:excisionase family DNA binding protein
LWALKRQIVAINPCECEDFLLTRWASEQHNLDSLGPTSHGYSMAADLPSAMTVREVAAYLNVNEKTVYRLVQRGALPGFKVAGTWRFQRSDIEHWIERQKKANGAREVGR